ncbi:hypothetical protein SacxiDRAFT_0081 [Saccharomonospora xinjiangensis XJ-54]|uniref:Uncharacterized protein n=1 Tax=Saccharomonospora xinjiangensis XJ-54 TaxID=882086 RepID=I0UWW3_9PSEU|nr:hypothetical protein SacxiDRAFT_0081 [Saccharomonospora xinjiangensis XJ-54]
MTTPMSSYDLCSADRRATEHTGNRLRTQPVELGNQPVFTTA